MSEQHQSTFKISKELIVKAAKWKLSQIPKMRQEFREDQIKKQMTKKHYWLFGRTYTREEAERIVDFMPSDVFDTVYHWQFQFLTPEIKAQTLISLCGISKEVLLNASDANDVSAWLSQMEQEQISAVS